MIHDAVRPLKDYYQDLQATGAPDFLTRHLEAHGADWAARLDEQARERVVGQYVDHLSRRLDEPLRSPLVRSPERQAAVEQATREFLERLEREHPDLGLAATPQFVRQFAQIAGLGVLELLMDDPDVTEIIVENHRSVQVEKHGRTVPVPGLAWSSEEAWRRQAIALCTLSGRPVGVEQPMQSFFFSDGSRVTVIIGPAVAHRGTMMNIRRKRAASYTLAALVEREALSADLAHYLEQVVKAWGNVVVCGESGCGKTSLLEALINAISLQDRGVIVQENDELNPQHPHLRYLLASTDAARPGSTLRDCTRFAMLIAPRRLIIGEAKEGEAADMLFAITAGFAGCMTTIHSYPGRDALDRLYIAALMDPTGRYGTGGEVLRRAIAGAVDVVVHVAFSPQGRRLLTPFVAFLERRDSTDVAHMGNPDMRAFFGQLYARSEAGEITKATVAAYDRSVRAFCSFCVQEKLLTENPMKGRPRARPPRGLPDTLSFDEIHRLMAACGEDPLGRRDRVLMLFMLDTGLRAGEVCALTMADLFLADDHGRVRVRAESSKDREERTVPVSTETAKSLRRYLEDRPADAQALFVRAAGHTHQLGTAHLTGSGLNQLMRRRARLAGIVGKRKWCHIWRHTFGKNYVLAGGDLETLRRLLGHASLETVRIYLGFRTEEVEACHVKFSPVRQLMARS